VPQLLALLAAALPAVNPKLLRGRFAATAATLLRIIAACDEASESEGMLLNELRKSVRVCVLLVIPTRSADVASLQQFGIVKQQQL
jgi:hypothetical protein